MGLQFSSLVAIREEVGWISLLSAFGAIIGAIMAFKSFPMMVFVLTIVQTSIMTFFLTSPHLPYCLPQSLLA